MGAFASEKVEKVVTTPRGVGTHPPTTGKTAVRPTATAKYPATAAMAVWSVVSAGSSMVPPARRPEVVTHALFGNSSSALFIRPEIWVAISSPTAFSVSHLSVYG